MQPPEPMSAWDARPLSPEAEAAWEALDAELKRTKPLCLNDPRFTTDGLSMKQRVELRAICLRCPVLDLCDDYAVADGIKAGFWGGHFFNHQGQRPAPGCRPQQDAATPERDTSTTTP
jgi:hypothetical protein